MRIIYWSDYTCPYCYIAKVRLAEAIKQSKLQDEVTIEMLSYELAPDRVEVEGENTLAYLMRKYDMSREDAQASIANLVKLGREIGLDFDFDRLKKVPTHAAHRLTKLAQSMGDLDLASRLELLIYAAHFEQGKDISDHQVLTDLALEAGLAESEVSRVLASAEFSDLVRSQEADAERLEIESVPFFVFADQYAVPGALTIDQYKDLLTTVDSELQACGG